MTDLDILSIDVNIRKNFEEEFKKIPDHKDKLMDLERSLQNISLRRRVRLSLQKAAAELSQYITELETKINYNFYVMETVSYIEQYKDMLKTPIKISFLGKAVKNDKEKMSIVDNYICNHVYNI